MNYNASAHKMRFSRYIKLIINESYYTIKLNSNQIKMKRIMSYKKKLLSRFRIERYLTHALSDAPRLSGQDLAAPAPVRRFFAVGI